MFFRDLTKLRLMVWKNFIMLRHSFFSLLVEFGVPIIICALIMQMKQSSIDDAPKTRDPKKPTCDLVKPIREGHIGISPDNSLLKELVESVLEPIKGEILLYPNRDAMEQGLLKLLNQAKNIAFGIQFEDKLSKIEKLPQNIRITLRFPSERDKNATDWKTEELVPNDQRSLGFDIYEKENMHKVMKLLTQAIIVHEKNATSRYKICMHQLPKLRNKETLFEMQEGKFPGSMALCFLGTCMKTAYCLAHEKETQLKESMKIMGLTNTIYILAWFIRTFICYMIIALIMIVLLCIRVLDEPVLLAPSPVVILFFIIVLSCSFFAFAYLASTIFTKAKWSGLFVVVVFVMSIVVFSRIYSQERSTTFTAKMLSSLFLTIAAQYGFLIIFRLGLQHKREWKVFLFQTKSYEDMTLLHVMCMLVVDTIIYLIIGAYVEAVHPGGYGVPLPWYFPFKRSYWCPKADDARYVDGSTILVGQNFEQPQGNLRAGIKIRNLSKSFRGIHAVRNLYLDIFENEITILMGHNGCGKTTTMNMLCGMFPPSEGTAIVNGYDIRTNIKSVQDSLGLCPQKNVLFKELTVMQHLFFFGQLKGLGKIEINEKIQYYLEILELEAKRNERSSKLSQGMKRKLSIAIAMIGDSKIIMLDEPTSPLDPAARRTIWRLLEMEKEGRSIILTTHMMDEADAIGDRIAIMSEGKLHCWGTGYFLKKRFGIGYNLVLEMIPGAKPIEITQLLQEYIPNIEIHSHIGNDLNYLLPEQYQSKFEAMLGSLEKRSAELGIESFGVSLAKIDDVFMKIAKEREEAIKRRSNETERDLIKPMRESATMFRTNTALQDCYYQILGMFMKKSLTCFRSWLSLLAQIFIPVLLLLINESLRSQSSDDFLPLELSFNSFPNVIIPLGGNNVSKFYQFFKQEYEKKHALAEVRNASGEYMHQLRAHYDVVKEHYQFGAQINKTVAVGWFSGHFWHSAATIHASLLNIHVKVELGAERSLTFINHPLPYSLKIRSRESHSNSLEMSLSFGLVIATSFFAIFQVVERVTKVKHLQITSGVSPILFWVASFIWDFLIYAVIIGICMLTLYFLQEADMKDITHVNMLLTLMFCFGISILPYVYFMSKFFQVPSSAFVVLVVAGCLLNIICELCLNVVSMEKTQNVMELQLFFGLIPTYAVYKGLDNIVGYENQRTQCKHLFGVMKREDICTLFFECCDYTDHFLSLSTWALGLSIICLLVTAVIFSVLLLLSDYGYFNFILNCGVRGKCPVFPAEMEEDVFAEMKIIQQMPEEELRGKYALSAKCLTKYYRSDHPAVNGLYLGVQPGECFGLLGVNGAGKTTTFMMLTGDVDITHGEAFIMGYNFKKSQKQLQKHIGYCPQFDALFDCLTAIENITIFCLIRGIAPRKCKYLAEQLAKDLDFYEIRNRQLRDLSGGNRRKVSVAIAMLGDPPVIFLDEPTAAMDPATKRFIWAQIDKLTEDRKCIVLTSHSMEECEALCTKLAIMVNGNFHCIGSTQHLKNKFGGGYSLILKMAKDSGNKEFRAVDEFVRTNFKNAVLNERHQLYISYHLPDVELPCSKIFGLMESQKENLHLEDYSVGQARLEEVFLSFTQYQQ